MRWLVLLFIIVPAAELALLIEVGSRIGAVATFALIVFTGVLGAALAQHQGLSVLGQVQSEIEAGRLPTEILLDGLIILLAGALLLTPGFLTDVFGFVCLVPGTRQVVKRAIVRWFTRKVERGEARWHAVYRGADTPGRQGPVYDVTPDEKPLPRREAAPRD